MKAAQIQSYYEESFQYLQARKKRQAAQLVLLSNMRRPDEAISSTLMITLFDRIMSSIYDDKIQVKFLPSQGINQDQINAFNILAQSDYQEMGKAKLDYDWCWDTLFFGRGYMETVRFDMKKKIMQPHVINPLNFGYDPYIEDVQSWRYYWKWLTKTKSELKKLQKAGALNQDVNIDGIRAGIDPYLWDYKVKRDQAREGIAPPMEPYAADVYQILEFYGYSDDGDKTVYWTDKDFSHILYEKKLDYDDGEEIIMPDGQSVEIGSKWPIVVKEAFRLPHSSLPISVADLLEDKHRAKAVLLNLAYLAAKDKANPIYGYNPDKVRDVTQFMSRQIRQHIPMDDQTAAWPLNIEEPMSAGLLQFINTLESEAESPVGAGKPMQNTGSGAKQSATQAALDQQLNDLAQSLQSKVMQFGEADFWGHWFQRYAKYAPELKEKIANIVGVKGVDSQTIDLIENFNTDFPPGVMVYSAKEAEYKELVLRRDFMQLYPELAATMDKDGLRNFQKYVFFPKFLADPSMVDIMFPKTLDEMKAEGENEQLKEEKMPDVSETDNHTTHIYVHHMVQPKTKATWFHIAWHEELLDKQKQQQQAQGGQGQESKVSESISYKDLPPDGQQQMAAQAGIKLDTSAIQSANAEQNNQVTQKQGKGINIGADKKSPISAAAPLKSEMQPQGKQLTQ